MTSTQLIQDLYRSFRGGDYDKFRALCSPDLEWVQLKGFPGGATWRGPDAVIEGVFKGNDGRWEGFGFDIETYLDAGSSVTVIGTYRGKHRVSGKSFMAPAVHVYDIVDGKVTRFRQYTDTKVICDALP